MGGLFSCLSSSSTSSSSPSSESKQQGQKKKKKKSPQQQHQLPQSSSWRFPKAAAAAAGGSLNNRDATAARLEQELLQLYQQHLRLERSSSLRYQTHPTNSAKQGLPRSASVRPRLANEHVLPPQQLLNKEGSSLNAEANQIVLVHGGGFGAWCWYKLIALLDEAGFVSNAVDLAGSGIESTDPNSIPSIEVYVQPLVNFLEKLPETEKVTLVGHDFGGACISYVMEKFPQKIARAVFLTATMIMNGQRAFDVFATELVDSDDMLQQSQVFLYSNGNSQTPTAVEFKKEALKDLLFNQSPAKDVALATVSMRPMPFAPILEKIVLTTENYGSIPRYYIETTDDHALTSAIQHNLIKINPPNHVFKLKGSDHAPFFSKPQGLFKLLLEISHIK